MQSNEPSLLQNLRDVLREAQPSWTDKNISNAEWKLGHIGIKDVAGLADALKGQLNERLNSAGLKTFNADTVRAFRSVLGVQLAGAKRRANRKPGTQATQKTETKAVLAGVAAESQDAETVVAKKDAAKRHTDEKAAGPKAAAKKKEIDEVAAAAQQAVRKGDEVAGDKTSAAKAGAESAAVGQAVAERAAADKTITERTVAAKTDLAIKEAHEKAKAEKAAAENAAAEQATAWEAAIENFKAAAEKSAAQKATGEKIANVNAAWQEAKIAKAEEHESSDSDIPELLAMDDSSAKPPAVAPTAVAAPTVKASVQQSAVKASALLKGWQKPLVPLVKPDISSGGLSVKSGSSQEKSEAMAGDGSGKSARVPIFDEKDVSELLPGIGRRHADSNPRSNHKVLGSLANPDPDVIPGLDDLLAEIDADEEEDLSDACIAHGIPVEQLEDRSTAELTRLLTEVQRLESVSIETLQHRCRRQGLREKSMEKEKLVDVLKDVLIWEALRLPSLRQVCRKRGLIIADTMPRAELIKLLVNSTWDAVGIPVRRLRDEPAADKLVDLFREIEHKSEDAIAVECKQKGMPAEISLGIDFLRDQLKKHLLWQELPLEELKKECKARSISTEPLSKAGGGMKGVLLNRLGASLWIDMYEAYGIPAGRIGNLQRAHVTYVESKSFDSMPMDVLARACKDAGLPPDLSLKKHEMARRMKQIVIWQHLQVDELEKECLDRKVSIDGLPTDDSPRLRWQDLMERLIIDLSLDSWEKLEIPVKEIGIEAAVSVYQYVEYLAHEDTEVLKQQYKDWGMPAEIQMEKEEYAKDMKLLFVWQLMPLDRLLKECLRKGVSVPETPKDASDHDKRAPVVKALFANARLAEWKSQGYPVHRVQDFEAVAELVRRHHEIDSMSLGKLQEEFQELELPSQEDKQIMQAFLKLWGNRYAFSWPELLKECREHDVSVDKLRFVGSDEEKWMEWSDLLLGRLRENDLMKHWQAEGWPVKRIQGFAAVVELIDFHKTLDDMTKKQLQKEYDKLQIPKEEGLDQQELRKRLKLYGIWRALSWEELSKDCDRRNIKMRQLSLATFGKDYLTQERTRVIKELLVYSCLDDWEARGMPAHKIGDLDAVKEVGKECERLQAMDTTLLRKVYLSLGLPEVPGIGKDDMLIVLQRAAHWKAMPLAELERQCKERKLHVELQGDDDDVEALKSQLVQSLLMDISEGAYNGLGIPVKRFGSLQVASEVANKLAKLEAMKLSQLREEFHRQGLPPAAHLKREELLGRLHLAILWRSMPHAELLVECETRGVSHFAEDRSPDELMDLLLLNLCADSFIDQGIPAKRLSSLQVATTLVESYSRLQNMSTKEMQSTLEARNWPKAEPKTAGRMLEVLRTLSLWDAFDLNELKKECAARGLPPTNGRRARNEQDQRQNVQDVLLWDLSKDFFHKMGIPVEELKSFQACVGLEKKWRRIGGMTETQLRKQYKDKGFNNRLSVPEITACLRQIALWMEMPLVEVQRLCRAHRVNSIARDDERKDLVMRLAYARFEGGSTPRPAPKPSQPTSHHPLPKQPSIGHPLPKHPIKKPATQIPPSIPPPWPFGSATQASTSASSGEASKPADSSNPRPCGPASGTQFTWKRPPKWNAQVEAHLNTLNLPIDSEPDAIKRAYKRLALQFHPDKNLGENQEHAAAEFKKVSEAYQFLSEFFKL